MYLPHKTLLNVYFPLICKASYFVQYKFAIYNVTKYFSILFPFTVGILLVKIGSIEFWQIFHFIKHWQQFAKSMNSINLS